MMYFDQASELYIDWLDWLDSLLLDDVMCTSFKTGMFPTWDMHVYEHCEQITGVYNKDKSLIPKQDCEK